MKKYLIVSGKAEVVIVPVTACRTIYISVSVRGSIAKFTEPLRLRNAECQLIVWKFPSPSQCTSRHVHASSGFPASCNFASSSSSGVNSNSILCCGLSISAAKRPAGVASERRR